MMLLLTVEIVLVLVQPTSIPIMFIFPEKCIMKGFTHFRMISQHTPWRYLGVDITKLVLLMVLFLMLFLELLKVVWVLVPPNIPPISSIVSLVVVILCHLGVGKIYLLDIHNNIGPMILPNNGASGDGGGGVGPRKI